MSTDFEADPDLGFALAKNHILVAFQDTASEQEAQAAVDSIGATVRGALGEARIGLVELPSGLAGSERRARLATLAKHPSVVAASFDVLLYPDNAPAASTDTASWTWASPSLSSTNWGLLAIGAPLAWNLKPLIDQERDRRKTTVAVIDSGFQRHPDLGSYSLVGGTYTDDNGLPATVASWVWHGTAVAGTIGAAWNGRFLDGVSPNVELVAAPLADSSVIAVRNPHGATARAFGGALSRTWEALTSTQVRPRLVNLSLGFNHSSICFELTPLSAASRCDPRQGTTSWGTPAADSNCDAEALRNAIAQTGQVFDQLARSAQRAGPVLFVAAAGNDSGPYGGNYCASPSTVSPGMGNFPAALASPMAWAGVQLRNPNIVVVEVVQPTADMRSTVQRATYSNVNGHILAPGHKVGGLVGGGQSATVSAAFSGTSAATPHVTGAAAYLLNLNPYLTNEELRALLLAEEQSPPPGTTTRARLFLPTAVSRMNVVLPGATTPLRLATGEKLLADMDDGTPHGFSTTDRNDKGTITGRHTTPRDFRVDTPRVDMRDFRYLRQSVHRLLGADLGCQSDVPACDLNGDSVLTTEPYPRALLLWANTTLNSVPNLEKLGSAWDGDDVQGYGPTDFQALLNSADLQVFAGDFIRRSGATEVSVTLNGSVPTAGQPDVASERLTDKIVGTTPVVLTTPRVSAVSVKVTIIGGPKNGVSYEKAIPSLAVAEHRSLYLNPCALEEGSSVQIFDPYVADCANPDAGAPLDAGPVDGGIVDADPDAFIDRTCSELAAGTLPYFCFSIGGAGYARQVVSFVRTPPSQALSNAYYYAQNNHTFIRMDGVTSVGGTQESIVIDLGITGNAATSEAWPLSGSPYRPSIIFYDTDFTAPKHGQFSVLSGGDSSGYTRISRYDAVGGMIEGVFEGEGRLERWVPTAGDYQPVAVHGSFRVIRSADR